MYRTRAYLNEREFAAAVAEMEQKLKPNVIRLRYRLDEDWTGAPAVFFNVVVPDEAFEKGNLGPAMRNISWLVDMDLEPLLKWGVMPYFRYRSISEQQKLNEPAFA